MTIDLRSGSMETTVSCKNSMLALAMARYRSRTSSNWRRPNITSSFENPKTKASPLSMSVTRTWSPSSLGQPGRQLQATEPGAEDQNP